MKKTYDVIVVGGGPAGIAAALASARGGVDTLLVERYGFLGGMLTAGLVAHYDPIEQMEVTGIAREMYDRLKARDAIIEFDQSDVPMPYKYWQGGCGIDAEKFKHLVFEMLKEAGVDIMLHGFVHGVVVENNSIVAIKVGTKKGEIQLQAKCFVDATGDGDVLALAGVPFNMGDSEGNCMASTLCFNLGGVDDEKLFTYLEEAPDELGNHPRLGKYIKDPRKTAIVQGFYSLIEEAKIKGDLKMKLPEQGIGMCPLPRPGTYHVNGVRLTGKNPVDAVDLTEMEIVQRSQIMELFSFMKAYIPGCEDAYIMSSACQVGVRESRRIHGEYCYSIEDIQKGTHFDDTIARLKWAHTDVHSGINMQWSFEFIEGPFYIPYRILVPQAIKGILAAGRMVSATHKAIASLRIMPICSALGEAAGSGTALAVKNNCNPGDINIKELQDLLTANGVQIQ